MNRDEMDALGERALQAINRATQEGKSETVELGRFIFEERAAWSRRVTPDAGVREALVEARETLDGLHGNGWALQGFRSLESAHEHLRELCRIQVARIDAALASTPPQVSP